MICAHCRRPLKNVSAEVVLSAVQDLFAREQIVTREILAELTGPHAPFPAPSARTARRCSRLAIP